MAFQVHKRKGKVMASVLGEWGGLVFFLGNALF